MTPIDFCYWLQGYCEIEGKLPDENGWLEIKNHLQLVFEKQTPSTQADMAKLQIDAIDCIDRGGLIC